jgi:hypothetical protein
MKYIYLLQLEGTDLYKIGFTKNSPSKRVKSLQTGSPHKIILADQYETEMASKIESILHRSMKSKKYIAEDGFTLLGEWFKLDMSDIKEFKNRCKRIEENLRVIKEISTLN